MAIRPVFIVADTMPFVNIISTDFKFYPGLSIAQAQKSVYSLQEAFLASHPEHNRKILEISSKSTILLGIKLSAFNLKYTMDNGSVHTVETVFQAAKCFENGCQYTDLLDANSYEAKKDERLHTSGNITSFRLEGKQFPIQPQTFFYDWLYLNAIQQNRMLADQLKGYTAFTDIAFNPAKSINCQARSAALYVSLSRLGILNDAMTSPEAFMELVYDHQTDYVIPEKSEQLSIFDL